MSDAYDVVVVGGGPVGMGLAIELGQRSVRTVVVERHPGPQPIPKGQNLTQRTMEHFHFWGCEAALRAARTVPKGEGIGGMTSYGTLLSDHHYDWLNRALVRPYYFTDNERLPQYATEAVLRARAAELEAVDILYGWSGAEVAQDPGGVTVTVQERDGSATRSLRGAYAVGCDGSRSAVREAAGIAQARSDHGKVAALVVFRSTELHELLKRYPGKAFYNVLHPDLDGYWQFFGRVDLGTTWFFHAPVPPGTTEDFDFAALLHRAVGRPFELEIDHVGFWDLRVAIAERYRAGRLLIAGDAAHSHPPYGGYGINLGFEDARNLGWKLAAELRGWAGPGLLDSYDAERRPVFVSTARDFIERFIREDREFLATHSPARDEAAFARAWAGRNEGSSEVLAFEPNYEGSPIVAGDSVERPQRLGRPQLRGPRRAPSGAAAAVGRAERLRGARARLHAARVRRRGSRRRRVRGGGPSARGPIGGGPRHPRGRARALRRRPRPVAARPVRDLGGGSRRSGVDLRARDRGRRECAAGRDGIASREDHAMRLGENIIERSGLAPFFKLANADEIGVTAPAIRRGDALRATVRSLSGFQKEALVSSARTGLTWRLVSDEGAYLNGHDAAPCPLAFFTVGMIASHLVEITALARQRGVAIERLRLSLENYYTMQGSMRGGTMTGGALPPVLTVEIDCDLDDAALGPFLADAIQASPLNGLMRGRIPSLFALTRNGHELAPARAKRLDGAPLDDPGGWADALPEASALTIVERTGASPRKALAKGTSAGGSSLADHQDRVLNPAATASLREDGVVEIDQTLHSPLGSSFRFLSEPAPADGGEGRAPDPNTYVSAGIAFCFMTQFGRHASMLDLDLSDYRIVQDTHFSLGGASGGTGRAGEADPVETHVHLSTRESDETAREMLDVAERTCFLHALCRTDLKTKLAVRRL